MRGSASSPGFRYLLTAGAQRRTFVKVSAAYRNGKDGVGEASALKAYPLLRDALGLDRLVWGSDWPHTQFETVETYKKTRAFLDAMVPDVAEREAMPVEEPGGAVPLRLMRCHRLRALFVAALVAAAPALAQQGEPIGSWWLLDMSGEAAPRHAIMTMSTQGSGVVAFQCSGARSSVLLGMNKPEFRPEAGATVALEYQIGGGSRHQARAALTSAETLEFDEAVSDAIIAAAAEASSFSFHLPQAATEVSLVFRPVETNEAVARMRAACAKAAPAR